VVQHEQDNTWQVENARLMNSKLEKTYQAIMVVIGDSPSDHASSNDVEDG